ncbi:MAG: hypothetical protein H0W64_05085 [Gammaproteobacteria bacterium]|nr:hypothetical protein [Gammaproteobacteria bacterium]
MRCIINIFILLLALTFSFDVFAKVNCPPTETITNLHFVRADGAAGIWDLFSEKFHHADRIWEVTYTVYLPSAKNNEEALRLGEEFYKMNIDFFDSPLGRSDEDKQVCYYAQQEATYFVRAISMSSKN